MSALELEILSVDKDNKQNDLILLLIQLIYTSQIDVICIVLVLFS